ncbi:MAG: hypothetical protein R3B81_16105 [bacterium]
MRTPMYLTVLAVLMIDASVARAATIDFEDFDLVGGPFLDVPESLPFSNVDGSGVDVTINGGADNRIYDVFQYGHDADAVGQALIDWPWPSGSNPAGTEMLFSVSVSEVTLRAGDFGSDDDSPLLLRAFDINDVEIGSDSVDWPVTAHPPFATLSVAAAGIRKVIFSSGGLFAGSVFIDDVTFSTSVSVEAETWGGIKALYR